MVNLLFWIVVVLAIITVVRAVRILELVSELGGRKEEKVTDKDNLMNGRLMLAFLVLGLGGMIFFTLDARKYLLPTAASKHGVLTDSYLMMNFWLIIVVFFITQILLFWFGYKYRHNKDRKAYFYPDNHKLEFIWTAVPAVVLIGLIVYGLILWNDITAPASKSAMVIEIYGKQFDFTIRYSGGDNVLGKSNFKLITDDNPLGVDAKDPASVDDKIGHELHIPVNVPVVFKLHSRDVIHSMYMPHLRSQMNAVPGMTTEMSMVPTITTDSMRLITKNPKFDYVLLCNKICGLAHYNMHLKMVIESPEEFKKWYRGQNLVFETAPAPTAVPADSAKKTMTTVSSTAGKIIAEK